MIRKPVLIGAVLGSATLAPLAHAREVQAAPPAVQRMIGAADDFRSAVRSLAAQPAAADRDREIAAADKALDDTQNALAVERLQTASAEIERSIKKIESTQPGMSRDLAIGEAEDALYEARRAVDDLKSASKSPLPASPVPKG